MASVQPDDAADIWRLCLARNARRADPVLPRARLGTNRKRPLRQDDPALRRFFALRPLADGDQLHYSGADGPQRRVRPDMAAAADRRGCLRSLFPMGKVRP